MTYRTMTYLWVGFRVRHSRVVGEWGRRRRVGEDFVQEDGERFGGEMIERQMGGL